ncbi:MAG: hypothetical protein PUF82_08065 [Lactobacillus equicursoris]|uniref:hypothetical protein n=1 Tax=Lactobacillus equicursoris TaxID=420645 RepID=UPI00242DA719|nr:hypothetical protein [Lactobacillus equicursoris]MDD6407928.1 hypothetical protein [Lactobacillus equicursoris]
MAYNDELVNALGSVKVIDLNREELLTVFGYVISRTENLLRDRDNYLIPKEKLERDDVRLRSKVATIKSCLGKNAKNKIKGLRKYTGASSIVKLEEFYSSYSEKYGEAHIDGYVFNSDKELAEDIFYSYNAVAWLWIHTYGEVNAVINNLDNVDFSNWINYVNDSFSTILNNSISTFRNKMQSIPTGLEEKVMELKELDTKKAKLEDEEENIKREIDQIYQDIDFLDSIREMESISSEAISIKANSLRSDLEDAEKKLGDIRSKISRLDDTKSRVLPYNFENYLPDYEKFIRLNRSSEFWNNQLQEFVQEFGAALYNLIGFLAGTVDEISQCNHQQKDVEVNINRLAKPIQLLEADYPGLKSPADLNNFIPFSQGADDKYDAALRIIPEGFRNLVDLNSMIQLLNDYRVDNYRDAANLAREEQFHKKVLANMSDIKVLNRGIISAVQSVARTIKWNGAITRRALTSIQGTLNEIDYHNRASASAIVGSIDKAENKISDNISRNSQMVSDNISKNSQMVSDSITKNSQMVSDSITNSITENAQYISENAAENTQVIVDSIEKSARSVGNGMKQMEVATSIGLNILADKIAHRQDTEQYNSSIHL